MDKQERKKPNNKQSRKFLEDKEEFRSKEHFWILESNLVKQKVSKKISFVTSSDFVLKSG